MTVEEILLCKEELNQIERNLIEISALKIKPEMEKKDDIFSKHQARLRNIDPYLRQFVDPDILAKYN